MSDATENESWTWQESNSLSFLQVGHILTPEREEIENALLSLMPAKPDEPFLAVEIGVGGGWLSAALLRRFPAARVIGLDGSETMLRHTERELLPFAGRAELRPFRLEDDSWLADLPEVRCFLSSLVVHHLDGPGKRSLFAHLYQHLQPGGAVLLADIIEPAGEIERRYLADAWDDVVRKQSLAETGDLRFYERFVETQWNFYRYPDPVDKPSTLLEQLRWLEEAGFTGVSAFWLKAGHAVFGGYKPS
jgi:trans-aconitate methyltransferase